MKDTIAFVLGIISLVLVVCCFVFLIFDFQLVSTLCLSGAIIVGMIGISMHPSSSSSDPPK